ncbi:putative reverse transcriptase zinc-binding domain-containing protein [Lupinus albus]|uniref:Putative reverse transcriptase zinc-binding domain-containing protein n=1 Tax=Lupinus albus TaxID=3870 RepID=A0A6A4NYT3_LUPAL|nr:putative reverse transcriptase zinc-binding domain-containing protein [Lupinus albus]
MTQHAYSLWKSKAPSKVLTFVWRLFQDIIPTKDALSKRGVPLLTNSGLLCSFCNDHSETSTHFSLLARLLILFGNQFTNGSVSMLSYHSIIYITS